ncbi:MAG: hypothetical protein U0K57_02970 [Lachnospiraceae bacterium]|nr:hypothetical protein [Lachnospiraceae bacterium]
MFEKFQRKMVNVLLFLDLFKMKKSIPNDFSGVMKKQDERVRRLVRRAYEIPFYKKRFDEAGVKPEDIKCGDDLSKLPLLTKDELRAWMNELDQDPKYKEWYHDTTSGSSGVPLMLLVSPKEKAYNMANWFRVMMVAGYNPFFGKTMSRKSAHSLSAGNDTFLQRFGILRRGFVAQYDPEPDIVKRINEYKPDFLYMNKSEFMRICLYCKQNHVELSKPKFYCPTGEKIDDTARKLFHEILGPGIIDSYGTAETGAAMVRLFDSTEYIVHNDSFVVNIYDEKNRPAKEGNIVVTPLYKTDLPLINYAIGDKGTCEVRDGVRYITSVQGRMNDFFRYDTGEVTTFFEIAPIIAHCEDIFQIRFIQETYHKIHIQCVQNKEVSDKTTDQIESELTEKLNAKFKHPFEIEYEWMDSIPPDKNGKLRMIVCNVD